MVEDALRGSDCQKIADRLNAEGAPTPRGGGTWRANSVRRILISPSLMGHAVKMVDGVITTRRDRNGQPISQTDEPLIDQEHYQRLQHALAHRSRHRGQPQARHLLWRVAWCGDCGGKLNGHRYSDARRPAFYDCKASCIRIDLEDLERHVTETMLDNSGDRVVLEERLVPGDDQAPLIRKLEAKAERLRTELADDPGDDDLARSLARAEERISELRGQHVPDTYEWVPRADGMRVRALWASLDTPERNKMLRDWGVSVTLSDSKDTMTLKLGVVDPYSNTYLRGEKYMLPKSL